MKNNQKGITLIALVVTIIVLLILAGVSIAMIAGEGGILSNARESSEKTKLMNKADEISLAASEKATDYFKNKYASDVEDKETKELSAVIDEVVMGYNNKDGFTVEKVPGTEEPTTAYILKSEKYKTTGTIVTGSGRLNWAEPTKQ